LRGNLAPELLDHFCSVSLQESLEYEVLHIERWLRDERGRRSGLAQGAAEPSRPLHFEDRPPAVRYM
jgi:hypothetical protein